MTLRNIFLNRKNDTSIALIENDLELTYKELYLRAEAKSTLITNTVAAHSNIALLLPNSIEYVEWYYAILLSECTIVPIYDTSSISEIVNTVNACDINMIITYNSNIEKLDKANLINRLYFIDTATSAVSVSNINKSLAIPKKHEDIAIMLSTSGSLNNPKRVMLTNKNLLTNAGSIISSLNYHAEDIFLILLSFCGASANTSQLIVSLVLGSTVVIYRDIIHPRTIAKAIFKYECTTTTVVPSIFKMIVEYDSFQYNYLNSLKTVCFGGAPTPSNIIQLACNKFSNLNLVQMYGQTEASTRLTHMFIRNNKEKSNSVGKPLDGIKLKIVDEKYNELGAGQKGEVAAYGDNIMLGYYNQPIETEKAVKDGWLLTGDIGMFDNEGLLFITGRKKNMLIYSGINIYPEEIEDVISNNNTVEDVIVYGQADEHFGEVPVADIVLKSEHSITEKELIQYCSQYLPLYKIPVRFNMITKLQRTKNGKKLRLHTEVQK